MSQFFISHGKRVAIEDITILVSADGYVRSESHAGKHLELILTFDQVIEAMREEKVCDAAAGRIAESGRENSGLYRVDLAHPSPRPDEFRIGETL